MRTAPPSLSVHWAEVTSRLHRRRPSRSYVFVKQSDSPCAHQFQSLEPILVPKLRIQFAEFPYARCSVARGCAPWSPAAVFGTGAARPARLPPECAPAALSRLRLGPRHPQPNTVLRNPAPRRPSRVSLESATASKIRTGARSTPPRGCASARAPRSPTRHRRAGVGGTLCAVHFRGPRVRQAGCDTLPPGCRLLGLPPCCLDARTPFARVPWAPHPAARLTPHRQLCLPVLAH